MRAALLFVTTTAACSSAGTITATWDLEEWDGATGAAIEHVPCPSEADSIALYLLVEGDTDREDAQATDLFTCAAGAGTSGGIAPGVWQVWLELDDADDFGGTVLAQSTPRTMTMGDGLDKSADFAFFVDDGYLTASWTLVGAGGAATDCATAGVTDVAIVATPTAGAAIRADFPCTGSPATFGRPLPLGSYAVTAQANGPATAPMTAVLGVGGVTVAAGPFAIEAAGP